MHGQKNIKIFVSYSSRHQNDTGLMYHCEKSRQYSATPPNHRQCIDMKGQAAFKQICHSYKF